MEGHTLLYAALRSMLKSHEDATMVQLDDSFKNRVCNGLVKIRHVIELHYRAKLVKDSFTLVGLNNSFGKMTVNAPQIFMNN